MSQALKPLNYFLRLVPDKIHANILSHLGTHLMQGQVVSSRLDFMENKRIMFTIKDTGNSWQFIILKQQLVDDMKSNKTADVHIQGDLQTFLLLAAGKEDPDSLFFSRKLSLEGNTEDGLYIKNLMDAMDFDMEIYLKSILGAAVATRLTPIIKRLDITKRILNIGEHLLIN